MKRSFRDLQDSCLIKRRKALESVAKVVCLSTESVEGADESSFPDAESVANSRIDESD